MNYDIQARHDIAITLFKRGKTLDYCAKVCGYTRTYLRQLFVYEGLWEKKSSDVAKERKVVEMIQTGYNDEETAAALGYAGTSSIYRIARENGLKVISKKAQDKEELHRRIVELKLAGQTREQIASILGVHPNMVTVYAKGVNPQTVDPEHLKRKAEEQNQKTYSEREKNAKVQIESLGFEYVGGFVNSDSYVTIRCPKCGEVFERSMISIRQKSATRCPRCYENERAEEKERQQRERAEAREEAEAERQRLKEERERKAEEKRLARLHPCPVCGEMTTQKKYCSKKCANRAANSNKDAKRRAKIKNALVDKDITVERLYERDHGTCYLCGESCDWNNKEESGGAIICGDRYPSIDHVIPLAKGGLHSWENVKLAHRRCNWEKNDKLLTTISLPTTSK